jgi:hypothetical protein
MMPPDPISAFLLSVGIKPLAFIGALILTGAVTAAIAVALIHDDIPKSKR